MVIRQFEVFANPSAQSRTAAPYVVVLQSEHSGNLQTVIVAPIYLTAKAEFMAQYSIPVTIAGQDLLISMPELSAVNGRALRRKIEDLSDHEDDIRRALDRLFTGF